MDTGTGSGAWRFRADDSYAGETFVYQQSTSSADWMEASWTSRAGFDAAFTATFVGTTTTTLASSANPSVFGQSVTFTGTGATPTGTVTFEDGEATLGTVSQRCRAGDVHHRRSLRGDARRHRSVRRRLRQLE